MKMSSKIITRTPFGLHSVLLIRLSPYDNPVFVSIYLWRTIFQAIGRDCFTFFRLPHNLPIYMFFFVVYTYIFFEYIDDGGDSRIVTISLYSFQISSMPLKHQTLYQHVST